MIFAIFETAHCLTCANCATTPYTYNEHFATLQTRFYWWETL